MSLACPLNEEPYSRIPGFFNGVIERPVHRLGTEGAQVDLLWLVSKGSLHQPRLPSRKQKSLSGADEALGL